MGEECEECGREFDSKRGLNIHKAQKHQKEEEKEMSKENNSVKNTIDFNFTVNQLAATTFGAGLLIGLVFVIGLLTGMLVSGSGEVTTVQQPSNLEDSPSAAGETAEDSGIEEISGMPYDVEFGVGTQNVEWDGETVELEDRPYIGSEDADIVMVSFEDYFCPFCTGFHNEEFAAANNMNSPFGEIVENHIETGEAQYYFKNLPVVGGDRPAEVSECIVEHGSSEAFWNFNHEHFQNFEELSEMPDDRYDEVMMAWAEQLDVDVEGFESCIDNSETRSVVQDHAVTAESLGASATPTNFINGEMVEGAQPYSAFQTVIESQ